MKTLDLTGEGVKMQGRKCADRKQEMRVSGLLDELGCSKGLQQDGSYS